MAEQTTGGSGGSGLDPVEGGHGLGSAPEDHGLSHVLPRKLLLGVFGGLVVLTWVTVAATWIDLGAGNLWLAMAIATLKASLVALFFMHLRWDRPINAIIFFAALLFVTLFVGMLLADTSSYLPEMIPGYAPAMPH
jgi:cytochrome c oxidase subunit IV